ncbi:rhodanese-like domain-containing protein [Sandaracinus amylolyticus]|uniref:rhodanese-like domain-containing protein n=1 Tax=Sandaracinus amylolyticus TaxID=927083 RepID=UPI001F3E31AF|nr:rhodanese-like domain-containing protein [Sandaracinus amylolyticus]
MRREPPSEVPSPDVPAHDAAGQEAPLERRAARSPARATRVGLEAARVLLVGALLGAAIAVVRGVPDVEAMRAEAPASCAAPVEARPEVRWIEQADAHRMVEDAAVTFVDARPREAYESGHVAGALNVPMETGAIDERSTSLVRGSRVVITYCDTSGDCASSKRLAGLLAEAGLPDVRVLRGGMPGWLENGYAAEAGPCRVCP